MASQRRRTSRSIISRPSYENPINAISAALYPFMIAEHGCWTSFLTSISQGSSVGCSRNIVVVFSWPLIPHPNSVASLYNFCMLLPRSSVSCPVPTRSLDRFGNDVTLKPETSAAPPPVLVHHHLKKCHIQHTAGCYKFGVQISIVRMVSHFVTSTESTCFVNLLCNGRRVLQSRFQWVIENDMKIDLVLQVSNVFALVCPRTTNFLPGWSSSSWPIL
ncbi:hypothetical protein C8R48DRAFT_61084 [Suillus tomentosus]|nr:hypothetical protein C8R48DRAFT_61084 [Suillus tomentosus]